MFSKIRCQISHYGSHADSDLTYLHFIISNYVDTIWETIKSTLATKICLQYEPVSRSLGFIFLKKRLPKVHQFTLKWNATIWTIRRHAISLTSTGLFYWHIYVSPDLDKLEDGDRSCSSLEWSSFTSPSLSSHQSINSHLGTFSTLPCNNSKFINERYVRV